MVNYFLAPLLSLLCTLAIAQQNNESFEPPPDDYDWVQLVSGEWLKGELISMFDDELTFESDVLDTLRLDWEDVGAFRGHGTYGIRISGMQPVSGKLLIDEQTVIVIADGRTSTHPREQLIAITPAASRELDNWSVDTTFGLNLRQGNTELIEYNLIAGLERRTTTSRVSIDYLGNYNETEGQRVANNHRVNAIYDRFGDRRLFWRPIISQYYRDPIQNIRSQGTIETGLGYELIDTSRTAWEIFAGIGVNYLVNESVEPGQSRESTSPAVSLGTDYEVEVTSWMDYILVFHATFLDEESGSYQHHFLNTLSTDLTGRLDLDVSFVWDRTQRPQRRADGEVPEKDDYRLMIGLGWEFQ